MDMPIEEVIAALQSTRQSAVVEVRYRELREAMFGIPSGDAVPVARNDLSADDADGRR